MDEKFLTKIALIKASMIAASLVSKGQYKFIDHVSPDEGMYVSGIPLSGIKECKDLVVLQREEI